MEGSDLFPDAPAAAIAPPDDGIRRGQIQDGSYRYLLTRDWVAGLGKTLFLMLNPSTADGLRDDPTIRRCTHFSRRLGHRGYEVANLFAFRTPKPAVLFEAAAPIGPENDRHILEAADRVDILIVAWGPNGRWLHRDRAVLRLLAGKKIYCLGRTKEGHPRHPLMLRNDAQLEPYTSPWAA